MGAAYIYFNGKDNIWIPLTQLLAKDKAEAPVEGETTSVTPGDVAAKEKQPEAMVPKVDAAGEKGARTGVPKVDAKGKE